jgi:hypothetical protein
MRTTIELEDDTARAVDQLRRERGVGTSEAVNLLLRRGMLAAEADPAPFRQRTRDLGLRIDVSNVADALETLDGPTAR